VHVSEYAVAVPMAAVLWLPLLARAPLQPPEAVHAVALVELHVKLEVAPVATTVGAAANATVGTGTIVTVAVAGAVVPPGPMQTIEYAVVAVNGPTLWWPLVVASAPLQPPEAVHDVAWVEVQVKVEVPPDATVVGLVARATVGRAFTVIVAVAAVLVPPGPAHVKEKVAVVVNAPVLRVPLTLSVPLHPPEALHEVAFAELHVSIADSPASIVDCDAVNDAVGCGEGGSERPLHAESSSAIPRTAEIDCTTSPILRVVIVVIVQH
jgi:hypothetical protein